MLDIRIAKGIVGGHGIARMARAWNLEELQLQISAPCCTAQPSKHVVHALGGTLSVEWRQTRSSAITVLWAAIGETHWHVDTNEGVAVDLVEAATDGNPAITIGDCVIEYLPQAHHVVNVTAATAGRNPLVSLLTAM